MKLSPNVKRLFYLETRDICQISDFDEIYYMMEKIIEYDLDADGIEGLSERLPYALNQIVEEKLNRQDILTFFQ